MSTAQPSRIALTGGMASGKSTVSAMLRDAGIIVLDADAVVAELYQPGQPGAEAVRSLLGDEVMTDEGGVDHPAVAARIFEDADLRKAIEQAIHPLVGFRFSQKMAAAKGPMVAEIPLLFEAGWQDDFDLVVTVEADPEIQIRRAAARAADPSFGETEARARLAAQTSGAIRRAGSDVVIENDGSLDDLAHQVDGLIRRLRRRA